MLKSKRTILLLFFTALCFVFGQKYGESLDLRKLEPNRPNLNRVQWASTRSKRQDNPCTTFEPTLPNFSAPGRRISEKKCFEYIWRLKTRIDANKRKKECEEYVKSRNFTLASPLVIGGYIAQSGEFPHMGAVGWEAVNGSWVFKCGSSLISEKFAITAAHCTKAAARDPTIANVVPKIVRIADKNIANQEVKGFAFPHDKSIKRIIVHPNYAAPIKYFDIALIEFKSDVHFSRDAQPACLWAKPTTFPRATVAGWGVVDAGKLETSPNLIAADVDIVDSDTCNSLLGICNRNFCGIRSSQLCAGILDGGVDACQGDSGGPLGVKINLPDKSEGTMSHLVGIVSVGKSCARKNLPGVYTRISSFLDWIEPIVWPGES